MSDELLYAAVAALAGDCDGAVTRDDHGFNGSDTTFGRRLALLSVASWTPGMKAEAHAMLRKYRKQLAAHGIDYDQIPPPEGTPPAFGRRDAYFAVRDQQRAAAVPRRIAVGAAGLLEITFAYDAALVARVRTLPGATWRPDGKRWVVPPGSAWALRALVAEHGFAPTPEAAAVLDATQPPALPVNGGPAGPRPDERRAELARDGAELRLSFPYDQETVNRVRALPGAKWDKPAQQWVVPLSLATVGPVRGFLRGFPVGDDIRARLDTVEQEAAARIEASKATTADLDIPGLGVTLRPFQRAGVLYAMRAKRVFICDEMGLGKTIEGLATLQALEMVERTPAFPAIAVVPASVKLNWAREARRALPGRMVHILGSTPLPARLVPIHREHPALYIVNYDVLQHHVEAEKTQPRKWLQDLGLRSVILDEFHFTKNPRARRTRLCRALCEMVPHRFLLSGTPILNRTKELVSPLQILGRLAELGGYHAYIRAFCDAYQTRWGTNTQGASNLGKLHTQLRSLCYIRRTKDEVLTELPPIVYSTVPLEIDNRAEYDAAARDVVAWLRARVHEDEAFLASIAHLDAEAQRQAIREREHSVAQRARNAETLVRINALRRLAAHGKLAAARAWVEDFMASDQKIVLGAHHQDIVAALADTLGGAPTITGATPIPQRQASIDRFQTDAACRAIVVNLQAGGIGINLTAASNVATLELPWNPAGLDQFIARVHRMGQQDRVTAWCLLGERTIDEDMAALIDEKRSVVGAVTDGHAPDEDTSILKALVARLTGQGTPAPPPPSEVEVPW